MANIFKRFVKGLLLKGESSDPSDNLEGSIWQNSASNRLKAYIQSAVREIVTNSQSQTLTNKTIDADLNTVSNIDNADIKAAAAIDAAKIADGTVSSTEFQYLNSVTSNVQDQINSKQGNLVNSAGLAAALNDETGTGLAVFNNSPNITTPTGIVKGDVGLGNVDNTSDATKNSASAILTNKTIDGDDNTISDLALSSLKTNVTDASKFLVRDGSGIVISNTKAVPSGTVVGTTDTQDLSAKTFTDATLFKTSIQLEDPDGGTNKITVQAPSTLSADYTLTLPVDDGTSGQALVTDGAGVTSWATTLSDPMTTIGDIIYRNGSNVTARLPVGTSGQVLKVSGGVPTWGTDDSGGSGGGGGGSLEDLLSQDELGTSALFLPDTIIDDFNADIGDNSNTHHASSQLFLTSGTTGYVQYELRTTKSLSSVTATLRMRIPAYAPIAEAIVDNPGVIKISGNLTSTGFNIFATSKDIVIAEQFEALGNTRYQFHASSGTVKRFTPTGVSYNSGTGNTEISLGDQSAFNLDFGVAAANIPSSIRVFPFDLLFQVSGNGTANLESTSLVSLDAVDIVGIPGESSLRQLGTTAGSMNRTHPRMSPNGQYGLIRTIEETGAATGLYRWKYSVDKGQNWTEFAATKSSVYDFADELYAEQMSQQHYQQMVVSDDGKIFSTWSKKVSGAWEVRGVYSDITVGSPTLSDVGNIFGAGAGIIYFVAAVDAFPIVSADLSNLSYIAICIYTTAENAYMRCIKDLFTTPVADISSGEFSSTLFTNSSSTLRVHGSNPTRRIVVAYRRSTGTETVAYAKFEQGNSTAVTTDLALTTSARNHMGGELIGDNLVVIVRSGAISVVARAINVTSNSLGTQMTLTTLAPDEFVGLETSDAALNHTKISAGMVKKGPLSNNHVLFCCDVIDPNGIIRPYVWEVQDISSYQGNHISQTNGPNGVGLRDSAASTKMGQTYTTAGSANRLRTSSFIAYQNGTIPTGYTMQADLYATTAGLPTGASLATSTNTYDPSKINKSSSGQWLTFNFNTPTQSNSTMYAIVITSGYPVSGTNTLTFKSDSAQPYGVGTALRADGSDVWSTVASDLAFTINGDFETEIGNAESSSNLFSSADLHNTESQIEFIDSNQLQFITRKMTKPTGVAAWNPSTGHPYRRVINLSSVLGTQSTYTALTQAAYRDFDENLVLNISHGSDDSNRINMTTGALEASGVEGEDRSGWNHVLAGSSTPVRTANASFQSGFCTDFNGSSHYRQYSDSDVFNLYSTRPFAIEFEVILDTIAVTNRNIIANTNGTPAGGFVLDSSGVASGDLDFQIRNSGGAVVGRVRTNSGFLSATTYYVIKIWYDGFGGAPRMAKATSPSDMFNQTGSYTEATYALTTSFSGDTSSISNDLFIGKFSAAASSYLDGKLGYLKFANRSYTFAYAGFYNQAPCTQIINLGSSIVCEQQIGQNRSTQDSSGNYDMLSISRPDRSKVDAYELYVSLTKTMTNTGQKAAAKITLNRQSTNNQTSIPGLIFKYS